MEMAVKRAERSSEGDLDPSSRGEVQRILRLFSPTSHSGGTARPSFTARNFFIRPPPSAPRRALLPGKHLPSVRVARAQEANRHPHSIPPQIPPHPLGEWPRLPFTARIERAHSYRARSASKKGTWPLPSFAP
jgi:hypothetical protein